MPISLTGTGILITLIEYVLRFFGLEFEEGSVAAAVNGLLVFIGFVLVIVGQLRRKDLRFGLVRK